MPDPKVGIPVIYLDPALPRGSIRLPVGSGVQPSNADLHGVAPHRVCRFHYSRTVLAFCCTGPHLAVDGCYPLCCTVVSGLSSPPRKPGRQADLLCGKGTPIVDKIGIPATDPVRIPNVICIFVRRHKNFKTSALNDGTFYRIRPKIQTSAF